MNPLDAIMQFFRGASPAPQNPNIGVGLPQVAASAAPAPKTGTLDWMTRFHNLLAQHSGGLLPAMQQGYSADPATAPAGYSWADIARAAQQRAPQK